MTDIQTFPLPGGATLLVESVPSVASAAVVWKIPVGVARDAAHEDGATAMLSEMMLRGAGSLDSRGLSDAFDRLGVRRGVDGQLRHSEFSAVMRAPVIPEAVRLMCDVVRRPHLADESVDPVRSLCLQSLEGIDDDPQSRVMLFLRERHVPAPLNRHGYGRAEVLASLNGESLRSLWAERAVPGGTIIAVAGAVDPEAVAGAFREALDGWTGAEPSFDQPVTAPRGYLPVLRETAQMHLALAWDAPREADPASVLERMAVTVLGGASSGRLFTEVRVRRGLCYSVGASYQGGCEHGVTVVYAGTTPQRAQETLDVTMSEIERLRQGVSEEEFETARIRLKSRLVMSGESTGSRAARLAADQDRLGRPRSLEEIAGAIDAVTPEMLQAWLEARDLGRMTLVSIGPAPLDAASF